MVAIESGLRLPRPDGFEQVSDGPRIVFLQGGDLRSPMRISVWLAEEAPALDNPQTRVLGDAQAHYTLEQLEGGSGGPVHVLRAYKTLERGAVVLEAEVQQELGSPDFATAWSVLAGAR